jgi:hypothetical protein
MGNCGVPAIILCMKKGLTRIAKLLKNGKKHHKWDMNLFIIKMEDFISKVQRGQNK